MHVPGLASLVQRQHSWRIIIKIKKNGLYQRLLLHRVVSDSSQRWQNVQWHWLTTIFPSRVPGDHQGGRWSQCIYAMARDALRRRSNPTLRQSGNWGFSLHTEYCSQNMAMLLLWSFKARRDNRLNDMMGEKSLPCVFFSFGIRVYCRNLDKAYKTSWSVSLSN